MTKRANGDAKPYQNERTGRWEMFVELPRDGSGTRRRKKVTGDSYTDCRSKARKILNDVAAGRPVVNERRTVADFLEWWQREVLPGSVSLSTERTYGNAIRLWVNPSIGAIRLAKLAPSDVTKMMRKLESDGLSSNTVSLARRVLRRALRRAEQEGYVTRNVASLVDGPRVSQVATGAFNIEEGKRLLAAARGHRLEAAFVVLMATGLRRGEMLGLTWDSVDIDESPYVIRVRRQLLRHTGRGLALYDLKTAKSRRTVHVPSQVADVLRTHRARQAQDRLKLGPGWPCETEEHGGLVFATPIGTPVDPRNFNTWFGDLAEKAGLGRRHPHEARHGAASVLYALGVPIKTISDVLGHATTAVTADIYAHVFEQGRREAADAIGTALFA